MYYNGRIWGREKIMNITRNQFIKLSLGVMGSLMLENNSLQADENINNTLINPKTVIKDGMPMRMFGKTGEYVSLLGLGGFHVSLGSLTDKDASYLMRSAIDSGINFFDNSREYNDGLAEERMGKALQNGYREKVFLMTKNCAHNRTKADSIKSLEESLKALKTDYLDLWLFHEVIYDNDPEWIFIRGGIDAAIEAKKQGKVRFIGFSGHKTPDIHLNMLERFDNCDAVMMPLNIFDAHFRSFEKNVLPVLNQRNIGIMAIKSLGGFLSDMLYKTKIPYTDCIRYVMSLPVSTVVIGMENMEQLTKNLEVVRNFKPMTYEEIKAVLEKAKPFAGDGRFEKYKTTSMLDGAKGQETHGFK